VDGRFRRCRCHRNDDRHMTLYAVHRCVAFK
jgi:hypothetical protein